MSLDKKTVARRYARALFELVDADNEIDQTYQELIALRQVFEDNEGLESALAGVQMAFDDKKALVSALQTGASQSVQNLIQMLFDYGRIDCLVAIIDEFERRYDQRNKRMHADVVTAIQLDKQQRDQLADNLAKRFGANEVVLNEHVDPAILGGVIVHADHKTLDGSLSSKIKQIRRLLVR
ncbi:ATP synthase F1 subunit delta [Limosilactobacillus antri]|uniref:ATP synthase subunit delta n=1 Tax=Limosilactobacillus antri DSM 16041 TaxID=525309 RepID=C8P9I7_9LACO|nr:ATP synthase F1 subunit delta [Limosilactobacillus antri]EEW52812.1 ATP synthase F1, delta subunit [Limosilactobacillus antri DSM 16041]KRK60321.1 ATP synthase F1 [Limosilactobacillus antri DSM 16041]